MHMQRLVPNNDTSHQCVLHIESTSAPSLRLATLNVLILFSSRSHVEFTPGRDPQLVTLSHMESYSTDGRHVDSVSLSLAVKPLVADHQGSREQQAQRRAERRGLSVQKQTPKPKIVRGRAGRLAGLKDMPMDIFLEVCTDAKLVASMAKLEY